MKYKYILVFTFCLLIYSYQIEGKTNPVPNSERNDVSESLPPRTTAELAINNSAIVQGLFTDPTPIGSVDENPPFLHFHVKNELSGPEKRRNHGKRHYSFKLTQDPSFIENVMESGSRRWSFYSPYKKLAKGKWYWKYGIQENSSADVKWSETYSFKISGKERLVLAPSPDDLIQKITSSKAPFILGSHDQLGNLLPEKGHLKIEADEYFKNQRKLKVPETFITPESAVPEALKQQLIKSGKLDKIFLYRVKRTRDLFAGFCARGVNTAVRRYFLTGSQKDKETAFFYHQATQKAYEEIIAADMNMDQIMNTYRYSLALFYDVFASQLEASKKSEMTDLLKQETEEIFLRFLDRMEHVVHNSHDWQSDFAKGMFLSISLNNDHPEAQEWVKYFYDLYMFRAPTGSRNDGGWFPGNGYVGANQTTLATVPYVLSRLTGYDYFQHPWYQNISKQFAISGPAGLTAGAFGDKASNQLNKMGSMSLLLSFADEDNPWNHWRVQTLSEKGALDMSFREIIGDPVLWYLFDAMKKADRYTLLEPRSDSPGKTKAALFPDIGLVATHTDLLNHENNVSVLMRACPYGQFAHAHAGQNSFNIGAGGEKLFYKAGYYTSSADNHSLQSYKHSRSHNTILADGCGQDLATTGYGWIARFVNTDRLTYTLGDASNAYNGNYSNYSHLFIKNKIEATKENGFGDPDVTRFRRHMLFLKPSHIVIYDELKAKNPVEWTFRLNGPNEIRKLTSGGLRTENKTYSGTATLYCNAPTDTKITDQFVGPAFDFQGKGSMGASKIGSLEDEWHASISTVKKAASTYFLTVIDVSKKEEPTTHSVIKNKNGVINIKASDYEISAQLDSSKESLLEVKSADGSMTFSTGQATESLNVNGVIKRAKLKGSTLLSDGGSYYELIDEVPDAVTYGNR